MAASTRNRVIVTLPSDREILMTRTFDAPRRLVFEAHARPEHLRQWWGLRDSTLSVCEIDFRAGGAWRMVQRQDDGSEHGFRGEYREIVPPERIVWTFEYEGYPGHVSVETMSFEEHDGRTVLTSSTVFASVEDRDGMLQSGMEDGANESLDRLEEYLQTLARNQ
jgi:uncharacterized protein YndB with AHSA1/START domain